MKYCKYLSSGSAARAELTKIPCTAARAGLTKISCTAARAELTIFFALISAIIIAMLLMILESARIQGSRLYMTIAANSGIDSLFSQYHRKLWEEYRLLGLEYYAYDQISDEMAEFMEPYLEADNWYPLRLKEIGIEDMRLITEDGAEYYEAEVLDYMKYGIAASVWDLLTAEHYTGDTDEGVSISSLSDIYEGHAREAMRLEESIESIAEALNELEQHYRRAGVCVSACNGRGFISEMRQMQKVLGKVPSLVEKYIKQAERMESGLSNSRQIIETRFSEGEVSQSSYECLDSDIREYESYVSEDGERRTEISGLSGRADNGVSFLDGIIEEAEEVIDYIDSWEPDDEDDELDEEALWRPVAAHFRAFDLLSLNSRYGVADKETEHKLEDVKAMLNSNLLKLVLPGDAELSQDKYAMEQSPSETCMTGNTSAAPLSDKLFLTEYIIQFTDYFGRGSYDTGSSVTGSGSTETEYIIFGRDNDTDNMSEAVKRLVSIRTGLNLIYLYKDTAKRNEARTLALSITGAFGLTPLATVAAFMIMSIWALGQAVCDVRDLLAGGRVPLMHDGRSFYLSLQGLLELASGGLGQREDKLSERGLKYADYLRILLFAGYDTTQDYRCMDIMQMNIRKTQGDFLMNSLIYSLKLNVQMNAGHVFSRTGIVRAHGFGTESGYDMKVSTAYSY